MTHDTGFAPNPFHGVLTLATCKPGIRRTKGVGDWIAGFSSKALLRNAAHYGVFIPSYALIYLGRVSEVIPIAEYFRDERFSSKIPSTKEGHAIASVGDNSYRPLVPEPNPYHPEDYQQLESEHGEEDKKHDLGGENVLVFDTFYYLGREGSPLEPDIHINRPVKQTSAGVETTDKHQIQSLIEWVNQKYGKEGRIGDPCMMQWDDIAQGSSCGSCGT